ncbi:MAG: c-type cytochrome [Planctomycetaceae bacterium]
MRLVSLFCALAFGMPGLLRAADSSGHWIWISEDADRAAFQKTFELAKPATKATVVATADNGFELTLNGRKVGSGNAWEQPETWDVTKDLKTGENVLTVRATNDGGPAAFYLALRIHAAEGQTLQVVTDASWTGRVAERGRGNATGEASAAWKPVRLLGELSQASLPWTRTVNRDSIESLFNAGDGSNFVPSVAQDVNTLDGFQVEKVFHVPRAMGSWVSIATDDRGGMIASDQGGAGLYRIVPGRDDQPTQVSRIPVEISGAQGLLWAFDSLYVMVNGGSKSGLHRVTDRDGDGELDHAEHLLPIEGGGEHGPHAVIVGPDKKSLLICAGNHTKLPKEIADSRIPRNWDEDLLLPRRWDANGHAAGILAPGGWICRVDPDGNNCEVQSIGFRNEYDIALNADGELFSYDADMEWDLGSPWYRPTRVVHATSGSEFGWRSGTGKWPAYYEDSLPAVVDIGPGSPVGIVFGYGAKFPAKYQRALYLLDWTYSTIYAVHLAADGSTYRGTVEDFVTGEPLQVTDAVVSQDGALYFTTGGRGTQSSLYRVVYRGQESVVPATAQDTAGAEARAKRHQLEAEHGQAQAADLEALDEILASLGHSDRFIRYAARVALEARPIASWRDRVLKLNGDLPMTMGAIAIARQGSSADLAANLELLARVKIDQADAQTRLAWLRAHQLSFARLGQPTEAQRESVLRLIDSRFPAQSDAENAELVQLLVYLNAPGIVERTLQLIETAGPEPVPNWRHLVDRHQGYGGTVGALLDNMTPARGIHYAFVLRNQKTGWTLDQRRRYFQFFIRASKHPGGNSYAKFLEQMRDDALATCSVDERVLLDDIASVSLVAPPPNVDPPKGPGRQWTRDEAVVHVSDLKKRNFESGRNLFHAAQCAKCHRLGGEGGAIGPDLSTAGRKYPLPDLLDAILDPSKVISDQYGSMQVLTSDGQVLVGRLVRLDGKLHIYTADPDKPPVVIDEADAEEVTESKVSQMPAGLVNGLNEEELKDLVAYLLSGGNRRDRVYQ